MYYKLTLEVEVGSSVHQCMLLLWDHQPTNVLYCTETLSADCFEFFSRTVDIHINPLLPQVTLFHFQRNQGMDKTLSKNEMNDIIAILTGLKRRFE